MHSVLSYPGSKRLFIPWIEELIEANELYISKVIDVCCGGANVSLALAKKRLTEKVILNDADVLVMSFWLTIFRDSDWLIEKMKVVNPTEQMWKELVSAYRNPKADIEYPKSIEDRRKLAFACLMLNRLTWSGCMGIGANINKANLAKFPREKIIRSIEEASALGRYVEDVTCKNYHTYVLADSISGNHLLFLDPPYIGVDERLYFSSFSMPDHGRLASALLNLETPWILTYGDHPRIRSLYGDKRDCRIIEVVPPGPRTSSAKPELIITNLMKGLSNETDVRRNRDPL